ncbi:MAG: hypothetical protein L6R38_001981 [Xanthoria sp. 2 TBL-2021]|nr:MAG: hypothetical protein L6R38_001981 [Xanthoria sp. 2 TBL-2021]
MTDFKHSTLGQLRGVQLNEALTQFRSLPYATIKQRFARSQLLDHLPRQQGQEIYDATSIGPSSIQPFDSTRIDADSNQLPSDIITENQPQSEDCLRVTLTAPTDNPSHPDTKIPVLVFLHGGAFFLNSGERPYYSPTAFLTQAVSESKPLIFVSVNYRLGALGFFHSSQAPELIPPNNGLHDQLRAFEWIKKHISGFGGDPDNVTAIGQSAGAESLCLHNISGQKTALYKRSIAFSGTPVTVPAKTPREHEESFRTQAKKLGLDAAERRSSVEIANDMIHNVSVDAIREINWVGAPCTSSEILPYERTSMELSQTGPETTVTWLDSQIVSSVGYDGSISWIITKKNAERKNHASSFRTIAEEVMGGHLAERLCELYEVAERHGSASEKEDDEDLTKICQFESDVGFICAAEAVAEVFSKQKDRQTKTFYQLFDLPNPFEGYLPPERYTTHSWDIVALLGAYDERLSEEYLSVVKEWRSRLTEYCVSGKEAWMEYQDGKGMYVSKNGLELKDVEMMPGGERRKILNAIAKDRYGDEGHDVLWEGVCRRWLDKGH